MLVSGQSKEGAPLYVAVWVVPPEHGYTGGVLVEVVEANAMENDKVVEKPLDADRSTSPSLTDAEIKAIAKLARRAEKHFGRPQDVEWAVTIGDDDEHIVHLLQSRPETVWSEKSQRTGTSSAGSAMDYILSSLLTGKKVS